MESCSAKDKVADFIGRPGRIRTCNQTVMSGGISISFVDFAAIDVGKSPASLGQKSDRQLVADTVDLVCG